MTNHPRRGRSTARRAWPAWLVLLASALAPLSAQTTESLPPKPATYFTDQANLVDSATAASLEQQLQQFERDTSSQILVAIYPQLPDGADVSQYSIDTYNAWQVGQKGKDNGAVLFVFAQNHQMFICTGRGLEGALPDATCAEIIRNEITPRFKAGDYAGGVEAGVNAMIAASKGEYKGTGETHAEEDQGSQGQPPPLVIIIIFIVILVIVTWSRASGMGGPFIYTGGGWGGGGFRGGGGGLGGGGGFGGGGFSGGGGSSAGGGASGSW